MNKTLASTAILTGTIIGAGVFGIPYVVARAGFLTGLLVLGILGVVMMILYLYLGEVILRTKGNHQLTGYAEKYLGHFGKNIMLVAVIFGICGALIAYTLGIGQALNAVFGGNPWIYSFAFFALFATAIYFGIKTVAKLEAWTLPVYIIVMALFVFFSFKKIDVMNLTGFNIYSFFVPYGAILFALMGAAAVPEMHEYLSKEKNYKVFKRAIMLGVIIPLAVYALFMLIVVGVTGLSTTEVATIGIGRVLGEHIIIIGNLFAAFTMSTSFLSLGLAAREIYQFDYHLPKISAWALALFIPLVIAVSGLATFIKAIAIAGTIAGGSEGIMIVLMHWRAKKLGERKPEYSIKSNLVVSILLVTLFSIGAAWFIWSLF